VPGQELRFWGQGADFQENCRRWQRILQRFGTQSIDYRGKRGVPACSYRPCQAFRYWGLQPEPGSR
jgi:hypothetical protein